MKKILTAAMAGIMAASVALFAGCFGDREAHTHTIVFDEGTPATCTQNGLTSGSHCGTCGQIIAKQEVIRATGHRFGSWNPIQGGSYRECSVCSYRETKYDKAPEGSQGGGSGSDQGDQGNQGGGQGGTELFGVYGNFDLFLRDCETEGKEAVYQGTDTRIEVNLYAATQSCEGYTILIPARVLKARFVGNTKGNPYQDVRIELQERTMDVEVEFEDVRIQSQDTIFDSKTQNIDIGLTVKGNCSFVVTSTGAAGKNGKTADGNYVPEAGGPGENGKPAMFINGNSVISCRASTLEIRGGNGGVGGKGGAAGGYNGAGTGDGGKGGKGGNAVDGERLTKVFVYTDCSLKISGGVGGKGGARGNDNGWTSLNGNHGKNGEKGEDGATGCEIEYMK